MFYTMIHVEWFNELTGAQVMMTVLEQCSTFSIDDGAWLASDQSVLAQTGEEFGENELTLTIASELPALHSLRYYAKPALVPFGIRIKDAAGIPEHLARASASEIFDWHYCRD